MKTRYLLIFLVLLGVFLVSGCMPNYAVSKKNMLDSLQKINEGKARVIFIRRTQQSMHSVGQILIYDGDTLIGVLPNSSYFAYDVKPGNHIFGSYHERTMDFLKADIKAGKTYYVNCMRYVKIKAHNRIDAIKKGSEVMSNLENILPNLRKAELNELGLKMFTVRTSKTKKFFTDKPGCLTFKIEIDKLKNNWLRKAEVTQKPMLLPEDGM